MDDALHEAITACGCRILERFLPRLVIAPGAPDNISALVHLAAQKRLRLCPTGTGSSFPANYAPPADTIFLLTIGLNRIIELRPVDASIITEAGILIADLRGELAPDHFELPVILSNYPGTLGGAVFGVDRTGERHAEIKRRLLGLEMIDPKGRLVKFGGLAIKNVAGFDYWSFLVGSKGRFGVLTRLLLNLQKMPPLNYLPRATYPSEEDQTSHWIYANLQKTLDPDGIFAR